MSALRQQLIDSIAMLDAPDNADAGFIAFKLDEMVGDLERMSKNRFDRPQVAANGVLFERIAIRLMRLSALSGAR